MNVMSPVVLMNTLQAPSLSTAIIAREACLRYDVLEALIDDEIETAREKIARLQEDLATAGEPLVDHLFAIIPALPGPQRRKALALKRAIFGLKPNENLTKFDAIAKLLHLDEEQWQTWLELAQTFCEIWQLADQSFEDRMNAAVDQTIRQALSVDDFRNGLVLTSPGVLDRVPDLDRGGKKARHARNKLVNFVVRSANKSALLNRLARANLITANGFRTTEDCNEAKPSAELLRRFFSDLPDELTHYRFHGHVRWDGNVCLFCGSHSVRAGSPRRYVERVLNFSQGEADLLKELQKQSEFTKADVLEHLNGLGLSDDNAMQFLRRIYQAGLVTLTCPSGTARSNRDLASEIAELGHPEFAAQIKTLLLENSGDTDALLKRSRALLSSVSDPQSSPAPARASGASDISAGDVLYETAWRSFDVPAEAIDFVRETLNHDFFEQLANHIRPDPTYVSLLADFIHKFGEGGRCGDIDSWLSKVVIEGKGGQSPLLAGQSIEQSVQMTLFVSILDRGLSREPQLFLHAAHANAGWQMARFSYGENASSERLRQAVAQDICDTVSPATPVSLLADSDVLSIQANPPLFDDVIASENQSVGKRKVLRPSQFELQHDPHSNTINFMLGGRLVRPVYTGGMIPPAHRGLPYMLTKLSEPFSAMSFLPPLDPPECEEVTRIEARFVGPVMVARGLTWVPAKMLRETLELTGFERYVAIRKLWQEHGFSPRCYVGGLSVKTKSSFFSGGTKASETNWFDIRVDRCLAFLASIKDYDWVILFDDSNGLNQAIRAQGCSGKVMSFCLEAYLPKLKVAF